MPCVEEEPLNSHTTLIVCAGKVKPLSALIAASSQDVISPLKIFATVQAESLMSPVLTPGRLTKGTPLRFGTEFARTASSCRAQDRNRCSRNPDHRQYHHQRCDRPNQPYRYRNRRRIRQAHRESARSSSLSIAHQNNLDGFVVPDPRMWNELTWFCVVSVASTAVIGAVTAANAATVNASNPPPRRRRVVVIVPRRSIVIARVVSARKSLSVMNGAKTPFGRSISGLTGARGAEM